MSALQLDGDPRLLGIDPELTARWYQHHFIGAWNARDVGWLESLVAEDVVLDDSSWRTVLHGKAAWRRIAEKLFGAFPDLRYDMVEGPFLLTGKPCATFVARTRGTMTGALGRQAPTGRCVDLLSMELVEFRDGLVVRDLHRMDTADYFRQLGLT